MTNQNGNRVPFRVTVDYYTVCPNCCYFRTQGKRTRGHHRQFQKAAVAIEIHELKHRCAFLMKIILGLKHRSVSCVVFTQTDRTQTIPTDHLFSGSQFPQLTHVAVIVQPPNMVPMDSRSLLCLVIELILLFAIGFMRVFLRSFNQLRPLCLGRFFTH